MDSGSVVKWGENTNTFTIHNQGQTDIELTTGDGEETDWIRDIRNHIQDCGTRPHQDRWRYSVLAR